MPPSLPSLPSSRCITSAALTTCSRAVSKALPMSAPKLPNQLLAVAAAVAAAVVMGSAAGAGGGGGGGVVLSSSAMMMMMLRRFLKRAVKRGVRALSPMCVCGYQTGRELR